MTDGGESAGHADTEQDESDGPVLPGRWRRKRLPPALTSGARAPVSCTKRSRSLSTGPESGVEVDGVKRLRRGRKTRRTLTSPELDVTWSTMNQTAASTVATNQVDLYLRSSIRESNSKRRGWKPKWRAPFNIGSAVHNRSQNQPAWAVDRVVGCFYENGKLYYEVRWENTIEPAENLQGCADTAIAEFHLPYLL